MVRTCDICELNVQTRKKSLKIENLIYQISKKSLLANSCLLWSTFEKFPETLLGLKFGGFNSSNMKYQDTIGVAAASTITVGKIHLFV